MLLIETNGNTRPVNVRERGNSEPWFRAPSEVKQLLGGEYSVIRLNDGRRMVILEKQKNQPLNQAATEMLHKLSEQRATIRGRAVIAAPFELGKLHA